MILGTITFGASLILAGNIYAIGPVSMENFDADGDGIVTEQEFTNGRAQQQEQMKASGRKGLGTRSAPSFAAIDTNMDGELSYEEIRTMQATQQANRGRGKGRALVGNTSARGPMAMANCDVDGDGFVTEQEFNNTRAQRQEQMKASGRRGLGALSAPSFTAIDTNMDGVLSYEEIKTMQLERQANRGCGYGCGNGRGKGGWQRN